jgi:hypothetical protein
MDTIRINSALADQRKEESSTPAFARESCAEGVRLLEEWELALAGGGGDFEPYWP